MPERIAFIGIKGIPACGGADRVVEALAVRLPDLGYSPTVYCDQELVPADVRIPGVHLERVSTLSGRHRRPVSLSLASALHAIGRHRYDLVHLHNIESSFVLPLLKTRYPVVGTSHGYPYWRTKWNVHEQRMMRAMDAPFLRFCDVLTSVSEPHAEELSRRSGRRVLHVPNGVGNEYKPNHEAARQLLDGFGLQLGGYFLFVCGRSEPTKGLDQAVAAVRYFQDGPPLLVVGEIDPAMKEQLSPADRIHWQGHLQDCAILFGLMQGAAGLVFPSKVEAMSMVLLEAAHLGLPIVCTDIPENRQILGEDALYFEHGEVSQIEQHLRRVVAAPEEVGQMAWSAQSRVLERFNWDGVVEQYVEVYRSMRKVATAAG